MNQVANNIQNEECENEAVYNVKKDEKDIFAEISILAAEFMNNCHPALRRVIKIALILLLVNEVYTAGHNLGEILYNILGL